MRTVRDSPAWTLQALLCHGLKQGKKGKAKGTTSVMDFASPHSRKKQPSRVPHPLCALPSIASSPGLDGRPRLFRWCPTLVWRKSGTARSNLLGCCGCRSRAAKKGGVRGRAEKWELGCCGCRSRAAQREKASEAEQKSLSRAAAAAGTGIEL